MVPPMQSHDFATRCESALVRFTLLIAISFVLLPQVLKVFMVGLSAADDGYFAMIARQLALTGQYALPLSSSNASIFDPEIGSGPALILPGAIMMVLFGPLPWVPGLTTLAMFSAQLSVFFYVVGTTFGRKRTYIYAAMCVIFLAVLTTYRGYYSNYIGEAPAVGFFLIGTALLHRANSRSAVFTAGILFSAALLTKLILLFCCVGACAAWFISKIVRDQVRAFVDSAVLTSGVALPLLSFELVKLVTLGVAGYWRYWSGLIVTTESLHAVPIDRWSTFLREITIYQITPGVCIFVFVTCALLAIQRFIRTDDLSERAHSLQMMLFGAAALQAIYFVYFSAMWSRYFWSGIAAIAFGGVVPVLGAGALVRWATILSFAAMVASPQALLRFYTAQTERTDGSVIAEKREMIRLIESRPDLAVVGQSWQSTFDITFLLPIRRTWRNNNDFSSVGSALVIWNKEFLNKAYPLPAEVASKCTVVKSVTNYEAFVCGGHE